jgi:acyl-CoA thioester hydrolase
VARLASLFARAASHPAAAAYSGAMQDRAFLTAVRPDWVDANQHMNLSYYLLVGDIATDLLWPRLGLGEAFRARGLGTFAAETWVNFRRELLQDMPVSASSEIIAHDEKRLLLRHRLFHAEEGWEAAENELLYLCIDLGRRKVTTWPADVRARFAAMPAGAAAKRLALRR